MKLFTDTPYPIEIRNSNTRSKYDSAMAEYLDTIGFEDEATGDVDWVEYIQRFGKRLLFTDNRGFVSYEKYPTKAKAIERFTDINDAYCAWNDDDNYEEFGF